MKDPLLPSTKRVPSRSLRAATVRFIALLLPALAAAALLPISPLALAQPAPRNFSLDQVLGYTFPSHLVTSAQGNEIAWVMNVRGVRNIWLAKAPKFHPEELTHYQSDDGLELIDLEFSADGGYLVYVRGGDEDQNWAAKDHRQPNPTSMPHKVYRELWSIEIAGRHRPKLLGLHARGPVVSPDGKKVVYDQILQQQLWTVPIDGSRPAKQMFWNRGAISDPQWSPDGKRLAFVTGRDTHSFIGVYRGPNRPIEYLDPTTSWDTSPRWSPDGKHIAFIRRPGTSGGTPVESLKRTPDPWSVWLADAATGNAVEVWKSPDTLLGSYPSWGEPGRANLGWLAGQRLAFIASLDGWWHIYSVKAASHAKPELLTPGDSMVKYMHIGPDRTTIYYDANSGPSKLDIDRRHLFSVNVNTSKTSELTAGAGIEWDPVATGNNRYLAFLSSTARRPPLVSVMATAGKKVTQLQRNMIPGDFPGAYLVVPRQVLVHSTDGLVIHCQLFATAADLRGKHPAIVYVHGGPQRQMRLGWHSLRYYDNDYAVNQYLAAHGFIVLSVNYRTGVGYGWYFSHPAHAGWRGAAEYDDVLAAARYLQHDPHVDAGKIGIWGGSYGGFLTSYALARNSNIFAAGVDRHGVENHITDPLRQNLFKRYFFLSQYENVNFKKMIETAWESSPDAWVAHWKSPVLLIQGDDDRNVPFYDMVGLVQRLRKYGVPFQQLVIPDEVHTMLRWQSWYEADVATVKFLEDQFLQGTKRTTLHGQKPGHTKR